MKLIRQIFSSNYNHTVLNFWMLIFRVLIGIFMLTHGFAKFQNLISGGEINFFDPIGLGVEFSFILVVFAEFFCSILLILGLFTRLAAIPLMFAMFVAAFVAHGADPFVAKEMSLLYMIAFASIFVIGAGKYSIDYFISKKIEK